MNKAKPHQHGHIPSFSRRQGRITPAQRDAIKNLLSQYELNIENGFCSDNIFAHQASLIVEIGFGNGNNLIASAEKHPDCNFIGIEVHRPGIGHLLASLKQRNLPNVKVCCADAVVFFRDYIPRSSIDLINLYFPDPWPKKRHHKRRLVTPDFASLVSEALKPHGYFHTATDWDNYAQSMRKVLSNCETLMESPAQSTAMPDSLLERKLTKFEKRGLHKGHKVWDLIYRKM